MKAATYNETFNFPEANLIINIKRVLLDPSPFKRLKLIPITNSVYFDFAMRIRRDALILPKLYAALTMLTGPSDDWYDDFKGSYSFTFELTVQKNDNTSNYCYHIYHYRSSIECGVYHIVPKSDSREPKYMTQPNDELFSNEDIRGFSNFLYLYTVDYMQESGYTPQPFVKFADSNLLMFGYAQNKYFFKDFEYEKSFTKAKAKKSAMVKTNE